MSAQSILCKEDVNCKVVSTKRVLFAGVLFRRDLPLPISNREVKASKLDDTYGFGCWESRVRRHIKLFLFNEENHTRLAHGVFYFRKFFVY